MPSNSTILKWDVLRSLSYTGISGTYAEVGDGLTYASRILKIVNTTDADLIMSTDAVDDYDIIPAGGFVLYDCGTNRGSAAPEFVIPQGTQIFVKGSPSEGSVYVISMYAYSNTTPSNPF